MKISRIVDLHADASRCVRSPTSARWQPRLPPLPHRQHPPITTTVAPHAEATAERRQVTVMFSDLVGSTALSARMAGRNGVEEGHRRVGSRTTNI